MPKTPPTPPDRGGKPLETPRSRDLGNRTHGADPDPKRRGRRRTEHLSRIVAEDAELLRRPGTE